ncbi:radical SAM/SPASM domain-containing protein [Cytophagales bacterium LB-30]|uniref:Radical SAM/SPASM domain-containing protein n=1 Tax=Shiella aurantiaca TaxID=3058365 RepID=A0ABT8F5P4_9BACT|nr:radical SAM/SPASM domain-containing protein [Shiella aurantiaca]MDN4165775.1 radical SAM/SPASM domain-containing protein [Shiella aurantiaca]
MWQAKLSDTWQFCKKQTFRKLWNGILLLLSFQLSRLSKRPRIWGMPASISMEPTTSCNLRCPECPSGLRSFTRPTGMLEKERFARMLNELAPTLSYLTFYFQGEPYLNPSFLEMVEMAHRKNIYTATSTNAHYLSTEVAEKTVRSGLDRLIISIDGTTQDTYQAYRVGGHLEKVIAGTKEILAAKKRLKSQTPYVIFQFLVVKPNEHQIADVYRLADELGVDEVKLKTAQIYDYEMGSPLIPTQNQYSRYEKLEDGSYAIKNKMLDQCWRMWHSCVITWNGSIVPCCFDKDAHHVLGSMEQDSFRQIWQGDAYRGFRQQLIHARKEIDMCKNCTEGTKVWA